MESSLATRDRATPRYFGCRSVVGLFFPNIEVIVNTKGPTSEFTSYFSYYKTCCKFYIRSKHFIKALIYNNCAYLLNPTFNPLNNQIFSRVLLPEWKLGVLVHLFQRYGMNPIRH